MSDHEADAVERERRRRGVGRVYGNARIEVEWEPRLCIHAANCVRELPNVFDPNRKPWIDVDAADADAIARTVVACPTGALHFRRLDGARQEEPPPETAVAAQPNGPLFVRGRVRIEDGDGNLIREDTRLALCRCGASRNKPFCDGSHRRIRFTSNPPTDAEKPSRPASETGGTPEA
jgi:uncharacterized Fe-S cluster protein YjdI/CDGSH-type Zn-finger protein